MYPRLAVRHSGTSWNTATKQPQQPLNVGQNAQTGTVELKHVLTRQIRDASSTVELLQLHGSHRHELDDVHLSAFFGRLASTNYTEDQHPNRAENWSIAGHSAKNIAWHLQQQQQHQDQQQQPWQSQQQPQLQHALQRQELWYLQEQQHHMQQPHQQQQEVRQPGQHVRRIHRVVSSSEEEWLQQQQELIQQFKQQQHHQQQEVRQPGQRVRRIRRVVCNSEEEWLQQQQERVQHFQQQQNIRLQQQQVLNQDPRSLHHSTAAQQQPHQQQQQQQDQYTQLQQQMQYPEQHKLLLLSALLEDLQNHIPNMRPRAVSSILWALCKLAPGASQQLQQRQQQQELLPQQQIQQLVLQLLHRAHQELGFNNFEPRQLCSIAYALTRLKAKQQPNLTTTTSSSSSRDSLQQQQWDPVLLDDLYRALGDSWYCCSAQDAAQAVYTLAQLQHVPPAGWIEQWLPRAHQLLPQFTAQGLANSAYGLVRVLELSGQLRPSTRSSRGNISSGELESRKDAGLALLSNSQQQKQQQQGRGTTAAAAAAAEWLQACMRVTVLHLPAVCPGELYGQLLWACGKLQCMPPEPALHHILVRGRALLLLCDTQQLATALYCFALMRTAPPGPWLAAFWDQVLEKMERFQGLGLAKLLWSAAQLKLQLPQQVVQQLQSRVTRLVGKSSTGCMVNALYSMVLLGLKLPERYLVRFQAAVLGQLQRFSNKDFSNMLWALATARVKVESRWLDRVLMASSSQLSSFSPTDLSLTLWAVAKMKHQPARSWLLQILSSSLQLLPKFKPSQISNTLWALTRLDCTPSPLWLSTFWLTSGQTLTRFGPLQLTATVTAVVKLQLVPPLTWIQGLTAAVDQNLAGFESKRLLEVLQGVQQLQARQSSSSSSSSVLLQSYNSWSSSLVLRGCSSSSTDQQSWISGSSGSIVPFNRRYSWMGPSNSSGSDSGSRPGQLSAQQLAANREAGRQVEAMFGFTDITSSSASSSSRSSRSTLGLPDTEFWQSKLSSPAAHVSPLRHYQRHANEVDVLQQLDSFASEAYSMACLVVLMPDWLQHRVAHWPKQFAAERAQSARDSSARSAGEMRELQQQSVARQ